MESRETSGSVSRQVNLIEIQLEYIERRRTRLFTRAKKHNRPIGVFEASSTVEMRS